MQKKGEQEFPSKAGGGTTIILSYAGGHIGLRPCLNREMLWVFYSRGLREALLNIGPDRETNFRGLKIIFSPGYSFLATYMPACIRLGCAFPSKAGVGTTIILSYPGGDDTEPRPCAYCNSKNALFFCFPRAREALSNIGI